MSKEKPTEYVLKLVVLGDAAVGKTSLINQYIEHSFKEDYKPTLGVNIVTKNVPLKNNPNAVARLVLWDLAAQSKYDLSRQLFFQGCTGALFVYDITRPVTKNNIEIKWYKDLLKFSGTRAAKEGTYLLLGNKSDLKGSRRVTKEEGEALSNELNAIEFIETSAKYGNNVEKAFETLVDYIINRPNPHFS
jgi:small GTP-binding protein